MKEHPIIFSGAMVRAILDGTKTQTRRVVRTSMPASEYEIVEHPGDGPALETYGDPLADGAERHFCPYGVPGDRLWVKETCALVKSPQMGDWRWPAEHEEADAVWYRATDSLHLSLGGKGVSPALDTYALVRPTRWRPSIHMPCWASRITLELTDVRVQRVQDISEEDARAEGAPALAEGVDDAAAFGLRHFVGFARLWDSINLDRAPWATNPWVWALTFKRVTP